MGVSGVPHWGVHREIYLRNWVVNCDKDTETRVWNQVRKVVNSVENWRRRGQVTTFSEKYQSPFLFVKLTRLDLIKCIWTLGDQPTDWRLGFFFSVADFNWSFFIILYYAFWSYSPLSHTPLIPKTPSSPTQLLCPLFFLSPIKYSGVAHRFLGVQTSSETWPTLQRQHL